MYTGFLTVKVSILNNHSVLVIQVNIKGKLKKKTKKTNFFSVTENLFSQV